MPSNKRRLTELGMVPPLAGELGNQIDGAAKSARRLQEMSMVGPLAKALVAQMVAGAGNADALIELGMVPGLAKEVAGQIGGGTPTPLIVLAIGQSNEVGFGRNANIDPTLDANDPRILQWEIGVAPPAEPSNQFPSGLPWTAGTASLFGPSPCISYAKSRLTEGVDQVIVIPAAVGSSAIYNSVWAAPSGTLYVQARNALIACLAAYPDATVEILWTQGEQDVLNGTTKSQYAAALSNMVAGFRTVAGVENAPFLMHGMTPEFIIEQSGQAINEASRETPLSVANCFFISGTPGTTYPGDAWHYGAAACRNSGTRRAAVRSVAIALSAGSPDTPADVALVTQTLSWKVPVTNAVCYVLQSSAVGAGAWGSDKIVYPTEYSPPGTTLSTTAPGSGARDIRIFARSRGGDSAPSATFTYADGFAAQTAAIIAAMTAAGSTPDGTRQGHIDTLVKALLSGATSGSNIFVMLDALTVFAAHSSAAALINWINPGVYNPTLVNSPSFTVDRYFLTNGTNSEIDTGFNPATAPSPKFTQDSACFGYGTHSSSTGANTNSDAGWFDGTVGITIAQRNTSDAITSRLNQAASATFGTSTDGSGRIMVVRNASAQGGQYIFRNGVNVARTSGGGSSSPVLNNTLRLGRTGAATYGSRPFMYNVIGQALGTAEQLDFDNAIHAYLVAVGASS